jgi:hypothetical protein
MSVENQTKLESERRLEFIPETSTKHAIQEFDLWFSSSGPIFGSCIFPLFYISWSQFFSQFLLFLGQSSAKSSSEVTLNALNASESEADVEGLADFGNGEVR